MLFIVVKIYYGLSSHKYYFRRKEMFKFIKKFFGFSDDTSKNKWDIANAPYKVEAPAPVAAPAPVTATSMTSVFPVTPVAVRTVAKRGPAPAKKVTTPKAPTKVTTTAKPKAVTKTAAKAAPKTAPKVATKPKAVKK
jgi:hypothetical protein